MLVEADVRTFLSGEEKFQHCLQCGKELVVLPDDRRHGLCFDCSTPLGPLSSDCPSCGFWLEVDLRPTPCPRCGSSVSGW